MLGAADTFRAAAIEQLGVWGDRTGVPVVKQEMGSDPASVAYDTLQHAVSKGADLCIIDTAGRLHNKKNLMTELSKVRRVMQKVVPDAPHEVLLVLDGSTGQNALLQAKAFSEATQITSLAVTKLDGTAKGGVVIGISDQLNSSASVKAWKIYNCSTPKHSLQAYSTNNPLCVHEAAKRTALML